MYLRGMQMALSGASLARHSPLLILTWYTTFALQGIWTAAFNSTMDALRFTHAAQMLLMYVNWRDTPQAYFGAEVPSPDGRWLFMGPRVCMAIHESSEYFVSLPQLADLNLYNNNIAQREQRDVWASSMIHLHTMDARGMARRNFWSHA